MRPRVAALSLVGVVFLLGLSGCPGGAPPPDPVDGLSGSVGATSVDLGWINPTTGYGGAMVRRAVGGLPPASPTDGVLVVDMPWPDTAASDVGLSPSMTYSYAVFAHGWEPNYAPAATVVVTTADVPPGVVLPGAATIGVAVARNQRVEVSWTPPSSDGGSQIMGYYITPYIGGNPQWPLPVGTASTTFTVAGLTNGITYTFRVAAKTIAGTGPPSAASNEATPAPI